MTTLLTKACSTLGLHVPYILDSKCACSCVGALKCEELLIFAALAINRRSLEYLQ